MNAAVYADPAILWARVLTKITVTESGCWEYDGCVNSRGYSCVASGRKGKTILGHRLAVLVRDGELPTSPVDHKCHNRDRTCPGGPACRHRRCIRPNHLEVVTTAENNRRMREAHGYCIGGRCGKGHLLTEASVRHARGRLICRACEADQSHASQIRQALDAGNIPGRWIREWARERGLDVPARGRIPNALRSAYLTAHQPRAA